MATASPAGAQNDIRTREDRILEVMLESDELNAGLKKSEAELKTWIELAQEGAAPEPGDDKAEASFSAFRNWLNEWREVARVTITQRSHLISLGLAARRQSEEEEVQDVPVVEAAPVSVH